MTTNIIQKEGKFAWRINLKAILDHRDDIAGFPDINKSYTGMTEFVGGGKSDLIT